MSFAIATLSVRVIEMPFIRSGLVAGLVAGLVVGCVSLTRDGRGAYADALLSAKLAVLRHSRPADLIDSLQDRRVLQEVDHFALSVYWFTTISINFFC